MAFPRISHRMALLFALLAVLCSGLYSFPQTAEDSVGQSQGASSTSIGGYGNVLYQRAATAGVSTLDMQRVVLFVGHSFNSNVAFFSELEMEDAKVSGGEDGGEIAFEQAYVRFALDRNHYLTAGLFLPRIGILNEDHLPTSFYGNERTQVETFILPSTWRELGIGLYGNLNRIPLTYSVGLVNGLNSSAFEHGSGIREGRFEGRNASANNLALTGSVQWLADGLKAQLSGYYGGTVGLTTHDADSLQLNGGLFGTPVSIGEADVQYEARGLRVRMLGTIVSIPDAFAINRAYGNNTPQSEFGAYIEAGYDLLHRPGATDTEALIPFVRYEILDMNATIPGNAVSDPSLAQSHIVVGLNYLPIPGVVMKGDVRFVTTKASGSETFFNAGLGFSF